MTSVHPRSDTRIRLKEVATLARALDADVRLYVQDGLGDECDLGGYLIIDTGPPLGRLARMSKGGWRMFNAVRRARAEIAHFHDPELLPWALLLGLLGVKVVYDVHEDVASQVRHNPRLPGWLRPLLPSIVRVAEWIGGGMLAAVVTATPEIAEPFPPRKTIVVRNYPMIGELRRQQQTAMRNRPREFAYVGFIGVDRGVIPMVEAMHRLKEPAATLTIGGEFALTREQALAEAHPGWRRIDFLGFTKRDVVATMLARARVGLVLFQPRPNNIAGRPNKLFEYMSAGLPVIASDFPRWREIVDGAQCGLLVDPENPQAISDAMQWFLDNPEEAQAMGDRGYQAILDRYSWDAEAEKLVSLYGTLLSGAAGERQ